MSTEGYAKFLRNMEHDVFEVSGVYWFNVLPYVYSSFPFHQLINHEAAISSGILKRPDCLALRYPCPIAQGKSSYRLIVNDAEYGMHSLTGKARNQTRRALIQCLCRPVSFTELAASGIVLNLETMRRQGRKPADNFHDYWQSYYKYASQAEGAEAWGCFVDNRLAAYLIAFHMENVSHILILRSHGELLKHYPNNALIFTYLQHCFAKGISEVSIGIESLQSELGSLDHFKFGLGFKMLPIGQRIELARPLKILVPIAQAIAPLLPNNEITNKFRGMLNILKTQPRL